MDIKDSYLHGTVGVVKSISVDADKLKYTLADIAGTVKEVTLPVATTSANGLMSSGDKTKLDNLSTTLGNYVTLNTDQEITGTKTFTKQLKFTVAKGTAPFLVTSDTKVGNLNADLLDGLHSTDFVRKYGTVGANYSKNCWLGYTYSREEHGAPIAGGVISVGDGSGSGMQIVGHHGGSYLYYRGINGSNFTEWKQVAFTDSNITGNAATADKVKNDLILKINSGTTEDTSLYTYNGSAAKTLDIKLGSNVTLTAEANSLTITSSDTKVTQTNTTSNASYRILFSGSANDTTETTTARKSTNLLFNPSTGKLTVGHLSTGGDIIFTGTNRNQYLYYYHNDAWAWRTGHQGTGSSATNYYVILSLINSNVVTALKIDYDANAKATFAGTVVAPTFQGNLDGTYVNALTGYSKAESAADLAATDTLNAALGKLEYKADTAYDWIISVTTEDTDKLVNKWSEIVDFLDSVAESTDITDEFVTRKTDLEIIGVKTFKAPINLTTELSSIRTHNDVVLLSATSSSGYSGVTSGTLTTVVGNTSYLLLLRGSSTSIKYYRGNTSYYILDSYNYSSYLPFLNSTTTHATNASVIYAPTSGGASGQILKSNGTSAPTWVNLNTIAAGSAVYLTVSSLSTEENITQSGVRAYSGSGSSWTGSLTSMLYAAILTFGGPSRGFLMWLRRGDSTIQYRNGLEDSSDWNSVRNILDSFNYTKYLPFLNSSSTHATSASVIYAPSTAGTKGLVLTSNGSGAPTWSSSVGTANNGIFYIEGTGTTAGTWLGSHSGITSYYKGLTIAYKIPIAGASTTTLKINNLDAKTCYINTSKLTTHYGVGSVAILVYDGTYFRAADYWDGNSYAYVRQYITDSTNTNYPLLFRYNTDTPETYVTLYTRYDSAITVNPSTNTITASTFDGVATKVACDVASSNYDRPIVGTNMSNLLYYSTKATVNWSTGNIIAPTFTGALKGNADTATSADKLSTVSKTAWGLTYWTSGGVPTSISGDMTGVGNITISATNNKDYFINFLYNSTPAYSWRLGYLGTGSGDTNYFVIQSSKAAGTSWNNAIRLGNETLDAAFGGNVYPLVNNTLTLGTSSLKWKNVYATTFTGDLSGNAATATTANILKATTIISTKEFSLSNTSWTDTSYTFASLASGTYAVQITSETNLVASGIMSVYKNLSDTAGDEIPLHVYSNAGWRPYLRTYNNKLLISSNDATALPRKVTIKIALIL